MAVGQQGKRQLVPEAHQALDNMKYELAADFGLPVRQGSEDYWGEITARDCGRVGGNMVRRLVILGERQISGLS